VGPQRVGLRKGRIVWVRSSPHPLDDFGNKTEHIFLSPSLYVSLVLYLSF
jgi:hypothetical protein